jgi:hypothetical protein
VPLASRLTYEEIPGSPHLKSPFFAPSFLPLPAWMRDNSLILSHYRPHLTWGQALRSIVHFHNETVNVRHLPSCLAAI